MTSAVQSTSTPDFRPWRPPFHWRMGVSIRKRGFRLQRVLGLTQPDVYRLCRYYGAQFLVRNDGIGAQLLLKRFEWGQIPRFIAACERIRPAAFLDIGANIGTYTCIVGRRLPAAQLVAFEPDVRNAAHLAAHLMINELTERVTLHPCAVGAATGSIGFEPGDGVHGALSKVVEQGGTSSVPVRRLDDVVAFQGRPLAIKMDVEGHELKVLDGAERVFAGNGGYAQIESLHDGEELVRRMKGFGWDWVGQMDLDFIFAKPV